MHACMYVLCMYVCLYSNRRDRQLGGIYYRHLDYNICELIHTYTLNNVLKLHDRQLGGLY